jgi:hypothetical protein
MQEQNVDGQETPRSSVLKRLASWSSSNSGWSDNNVHSSGTYPVVLDDLQGIISVGLLR